MNFTIRPWSTEDLDSLVKNANNDKVGKYLRDIFPYPYTREDGKKFIAMVMSEQENKIYAIDVNGNAVGAIGIHPQTDIMRKNAELGYWLGEAYWGNGIISKAIAQIIPVAFNTFDINRLFAGCFGANIPSQKVLEKNGFILEARIEKVYFKNGHFDDQLIYSLRK